jgi:hypothetical protein
LQFIERIGVEAVQEVILSVLMGENIRSMADDQIRDFLKTKLSSISIQDFLVPV